MLIGRTAELAVPPVLSRLLPARDCRRRCVLQHRVDLRRRHAARHTPPSVLDRAGWHADGGNTAARINGHQRRRRESTVLLTAGYDEHPGSLRGLLETNGVHPCLRQTANVERHRLSTSVDDSFGRARELIGDELP